MESRHVQQSGGHHAGLRPGGERGECRAGHGQSRHSDVQEGVEQSEQEGGPRLSPPDISDSNANPAPVPSDRLAGEEQEGERAAAQPGQENFAFLAARGLITASEEEDQAEAGNSGKEEASSPVKQ